MDFSDLVPLKKLIGDAEVVQLGEQSHGDGKCFSTKIRLIKFLHQEMGFDVLAFESGFYDCHRAWQAYRDGQSGLEAAQLGVFGIWTGSKQTGPLWNYLQEQSQSSKPLELVGFDCQYTAASSRRYLKNDLESLIRDAKFAINEDDERTFFANLKKLSSGDIPEGDNKGFLALLDKLQNHLATAENVNPDRCQFWQQQLKSMSAHAAYRWSNESEQWGKVKSRDAQMADNLKWLAEHRYPNRKIIVWAASFHIARNLKMVEVPDGSVNYSDLIQMGQIAHETINSRKLLTIGFTAYDGKAGTWFRSSWNVGKSPEGTFEDICFKAGLQNAWIPLTGKWHQEKQFMRPLGYSWMKSRWHDNFDAIIFNRTMTPSTR